MDYGHRESDKLLKQLEYQINKEFNKAKKELKKTSEEALKVFKEKDNEMLKKYKKGQITKKQYVSWRNKNILQEKRIKELEKRISNDIAEKDIYARKLINEHTKEVYCFNHNFGTFEVEKGLGIDTSYTLYNKDTIASLLLPMWSEEIAKAELVKWNMKKVRSALTQSMLLGESIPKMAVRLSKKVGETNRKVAIRNARTLTTSAENRGRIDSYKRAIAMDIDIQKMWVSATDSRVRASHRLLNGEIKNIDEEFSNGLMYPADPNGEPSEVYNCRCALVGVVEGGTLPEQNQARDYSVWEDSR